MDLRVERIAYQIHWLIQTTAGDCTLQDMAALTGASLASCREVTRQRGWSGMYRKTALSHSGGRARGIFSRASNHILAADEDLSALAARGH